MDPQRAEFRSRIQSLNAKHLRSRFVQTRTKMTLAERLRELWQANVASYRENWIPIWTWILGISAFLLLLPVSSYGSYVVLVGLYVIHVLRRSRVGLRDVTRLKR